MPGASLSYQCMHNKWTRTGFGLFASAHLDVIVVCYKNNKTDRQALLSNSNSKKCRSITQTCMYRLPRWRRLCKSVILREKNGVPPHARWCSHKFTTTILCWFHACTLHCIIGDTDVSLLQREMLPQFLRPREQSTRKIDILWHSVLEYVWPRELDLWTDPHLPTWEQTR